MLIIIISRSSLKLGLVGSKTRLLGQQATQVSDLGPLWPSCLPSPTFHYRQDRYIITLTANNPVSRSTVRQMLFVLDRPYCNEPKISILTESGMKVGLLKHLSLSQRLIYYL